MVPSKLQQSTVMSGKRPPTTVLEHNVHPFALSNGGRFSNYTLACVTAYERKCDVLCPDGTLVTYQECYKIWSGWKNRIDPYFKPPEAK